MRHENDSDAIVVHNDRFRVVSADWNPEGSLLAMAGFQGDLPEGDQSVVLFFNALGQKVRMLRVPGKEIGGCAWESTGLRIALAVDSHIYFANIRPDYKWGYCGQTVVYSYQKPERTERSVVFWDTKLDEVLYCTFGAWGKFVNIFES